MAVYSYRCGQCGPFEVSRPMGQAASAEPCSGCGAPAARKFTAPRVQRGNNAWNRAYEHAESTAENPGVVSAPPPSGQARISRDPRHARLPRP